MIALLCEGSLHSFGAESATCSLHSSRKAGSIDSVTARLEVSGNVLLAPTKKKDKPEDKPDQVPLSVSCTRNYDEKTLEVPKADSKRWRSVRHYSEAFATVKEGEAARKLTLPPEQSLIGVEVVPFSMTPYCLRGPLGGDGLELLVATGDSLPLDGLLPADPVAVGQKWKISNEVMGALLDLEEISTNTVEAVLKEATPGVARLELAGNVEGKRFGATNRIELTAKCRFDRKTQRIDWFALKVKLKRDRWIESGLDLIAVAQVQITPKESSEKLSDAALKDLPQQPTAALCKVQFETPDGDRRLLHDRWWILISHQRDLDVFRRIERGQDIAVCKLSPLPNSESGKRVTLDQFQADVREALGKNFGQIVEAVEFTNSEKYRVYRVIIQGKDGEVPAQWQYFLVSSDDGRQAAFAFRIEEKQVEAFGKAGQLLVDSFRFADTAKKK